MSIFKTSLFAFSIFLISACSNENEQAQRQERQTQIQQQTVQLSDQSKSEIGNLLEHYFELKDALVSDDAEQAASKAEVLNQLSSELELENTTTETAAIWNAYRERLLAESQSLTETGELAQQRVSFEAISQTMIELVDTFKPVGYEVYQQSCPMVNGGSADWLSRDEEIKNPYHGDRMLNCGEVVRSI